MQTCKSKLEDNQKFSVGPSWWWGSDSGASEEEAISLARKEINRSINQGDVRADFSGLRLKRMPEEFGDLQYHTTFFHGTLTGCMHLCLGGNLLSILPPDIFHFRHLTVLSLRNNLLREIPSEIQYLKNLRELSIGGNHIEYLPVELLRLNQLEALFALPNPFMTDNSSFPLSETQPFKLMELCARVIFEEAYQARLRKKHGSKPPLKKWNTIALDNVIPKKTDVSRQISDKAILPDVSLSPASHQMPSPAVSIALSNGSSVRTFQRWHTDIGTLAPASYTSSREDNSRQETTSNQLLDISNPLFDDDDNFDTVKTADKRIELEAAEHTLNSKLEKESTKKYQAMEMEGESVKRVPSQFFQQGFDLLSRDISPLQPLLRMHDLPQWLEDNGSRSPILPLPSRKSSFGKTWSFNHEYKNQSSPLLVPEHVAGYLEEHALSGGQCFVCKTPVVKLYLVDILFYDCCKNARLPFRVKLCTRKCFQTVSYRTLRQKYSAK